MSNEHAAKSSGSPLLSVPAFWPIVMAAALAEQGVELYAKNLRFVEEEVRIQGTSVTKAMRPNFDQCETPKARSDQAAPGSRPSYCGPR
jgi:hypothetical protein